MLPFLLESATRSLALGIVVWAALRLFRIRTPQNRSMAWTAVLLSSVTMPLLMKVMASAPPATVAWIPAVATPSFVPPSRPLAPALSPSTTSDTDWFTVAAVVYLFVAGVFVFRLLAGLWRGRRLVNEATPLRELGNPGSDLRVSENLTIPVTYGSTILFPADWVEWSAFKRDAVLLHELSHVRRHDFHIHLVADLHRAVLWFSPMSWWLRRELLQLAEAACDDEAIRKVEDRVSYAEILVELAGKGSASGFAGVPMASGRTVEKRVERLLHESTIVPQASLVRRTGLIAAFVPLVAVVAGTWNVRAATTPIALPLVVQVPQAVPPQAPTAVATPAPAPAQPPPQAVPTSLLVKWPEEEVPYLITAEEQIVFQRLRTDEEREQFINAFWLRRDPSPGTFDNEFRDEYYRLIVRANEKFTTRSGIPGWRTDRGRISVMHGPPDEIETHAQGGTYIRPGGPTVNTFPFERWRYRNIAGLGNNIILEFVDSARDGNYRLESDAVSKSFFERVPAGPPR